MEREVARVNLAKIGMLKIPMAIMLLIAPRPKNRGDENGAQHSRKPVEHIRDPHDEFIHPPSVKGGNGAKEDAKSHADGNRNQTHDDRIDRSLHYPAQDIPSVLICSQIVGLVGSLKSFGEVHPVGIIGSEDQAEKGSQKDRQGDEKPDRKIDVSKWTTKAHLVFAIPLTLTLSPETVS